MSDTDDELSPKALRELEAVLVKLDDCDLKSWDRDFVDDMSRRVIRWKERTKISGRQWAQLERIKDQHL